MLNEQVKEREREVQNKNIAQLLNERNNKNIQYITDYNTIFGNNKYSIGEIIYFSGTSFAPIKYYEYISYKRMKEVGDLYYDDIKFPLPISRKGGLFSLSEEQYNVAMLFLSGKLWNIYIAGDAGTGKTVVTEYIIENLERYYDHQFEEREYYKRSGKLQRKVGSNNVEKKYIEVKIGLTGSMGVTAVNVKGEKIKGETLHSRLGIFKSIQNISPETLSKMIGGVKRQEIKDTDVLLIDECFILNSDFFETINRLFQVVRENDYPFGGVRLVLVGDPNQLGPIDEGEKVRKYQKEKGLQVRQVFTDEELSQNEELFFSQKEPEEIQQYRMSLYIFESKAWKEAIGDSVGYLTQIMRQINDQSDPDQLYFLKFLKRLKMGELTLEDKKWFIEKTILRNKYGEIETDIVKRINEIKSDNTVLYTTNLAVNSFNILKLANMGTEGRVYHAEDEGKNTDIRMEPPYPEKLILKLTCPFMLLKNMLRVGLYNGSKGYVVGFQDDTNFPYVYFPLNQDERVVFPEPTKEEQYNALSQFITNLIETKKDRIFVIRPITWINEKQNVKLFNRKQLPGKVYFSSTVYKVQGFTLPRITIDPAEQIQPGSLYTSLTRVRRISDIVVFSRKFNKKLRYEKSDKIYEQMIQPTVLVNIVEFNIICQRKSEQNLKLLEEEVNKTEHK